MLVVLASEFPLVQPDLYAQQIPPVVYLSGVLLFVAGLAIVRSHNVWAWNWTVLITVCGWALLVLGGLRMFAAGAYRRSSAAIPSWLFMTIEGALFLLAAYMTFKAYRRSD